MLLTLSSYGLVSSPPLSRPLFCEKHVIQTEFGAIDLGLRCSDVPKFLVKLLQCIKSRLTNF